MRLRESRCGDIDCILVEHDDLELVLSQSVGPRILRFGLAGEPSVFGEHPRAAVTTELGEWKPIGGHRLWVAPESKPESYAPDNEPVEIEEEDDSIEMLQQVDATGIEKQLSISFDERKTVIIDHTLTNRADVTREVAAWALTIMRPGGTAIIPQEKYRSHSEALLPARVLTLWHYTDMSDVRWKFASRHIELRVDPGAHSPQKIGAANAERWIAYRIGDLTFVKTFAFEKLARYPDMGSNCEIYTSGDFVELESLGPLTNLAPSESLHHQERWYLRKEKNVPEESGALVDHIRSIIE